MSDAPETIWADNCGHYWNGGNIQGLTQYTRTDTIDAIKAQVWQEAIEAAIRHFDVDDLDGERTSDHCRYAQKEIATIPNPHEVKK